MIEYKSEDGYFTITEEINTCTIRVVYLYSTPIFGIDGFETQYIYNLEGELLMYSNSLGDNIQHQQPLKVNHKLRIMEKL